MHTAVKLVAHSLSLSLTLSATLTRTGAPSFLKWTHHLAHFGFVACILGYGIWNGSDIAVYPTDKCIFLLFSSFAICEVEKIVCLDDGIL